MTETTMAEAAVKSAVETARSEAMAAEWTG